VKAAPRQFRDAQRHGARAADADELGVALCHELGCDAGAGSAVTKVLADRLTRDEQQALRRCRSHSPSGHQPKPADLFPDGRRAQLRRRGPDRSREAAPPVPERLCRCRHNWSYAERLVMPSHRLAGNVLPAQRDLACRATRHNRTHCCEGRELRHRRCDAAAARDCAALR
jgi:hypothetical protein